MNEELRQDSIVRFCEVLTARVRGAITTLGFLSPGYGVKALFDADHNIIRLEGRVVNEDWLYQVTLDDGSKHTFRQGNTTAVRKYVTERFNLIAFDVEEMYVNGDIHFSKKEIDKHPSGLSTGFNKYLNMQLSGIRTWEGFRKCLTEKMRWYTQVHRDTWEPAATLQRGIDRGCQLTEITCVRQDQWTVEWQFEWDDQVITRYSQLIAYESGRDIYNKIVHGIFGEALEPDWLIGFNKPRELL